MLPGPCWRPGTRLHLQPSVCLTTWCSPQSCWQRQTRTRGWGPPLRARRGAAAAAALAPGRHHGQGSIAAGRARPGTRSGLLRRRRRRCARDGPGPGRTRAVAVLDGVVEDGSVGAGRARALPAVVGAAVEGDALLIGVAEPARPSGSSGRAGGRGGGGGGGGGTRRLEAPHGRPAAQLRPSRAAPRCRDGSGRMRGASAAAGGAAAAGSERGRRKHARQGARVPGRLRAPPRASAGGPATHWKPLFHI